VQVSFLSAAAFALDGAAEWWWREAARCRRCVVWRDGNSARRNRNGTWREVVRNVVVVGRRRSEVVVARRVAVVDRIRWTRISAAARAGLVVVVVVGHA
jgi:hypothetical protein